MCCENNSKAECLPFKDPLFITAQSLSLVAFFFGTLSVFGFIFGLVATILLSVPFCCRMNKGGLITAGVFQCVAAASIIMSGVVCVSSDGYDYDDDYYDDDDGFYFRCNTARALISFAGACLFIIAGVCVFVFACGPRFEKFRQREDEGLAMRPTQATKTDIPVVSATTISGAPVMTV